jgi:homocysteine S-methyltransferase
METFLIFHRGLELPLFASFPLLETQEGRAELRAYYEPFVQLAVERGLTAVLDTPTWRANADWGAQLGYPADDLARVNRYAVGFVRDLPGPVAVSGAIGPRDDGYRPAALMAADEAQQYHSPQVAALAGADFVTALTMTHPEEAIGIARAARSQGLPVVISFTVETDGRLPNGQALGESKRRDEGQSDGAGE